MIGDVLQARIREYAPANAVEQENVLQELMQHYVLAALSRSGIFSEAVFHGGTCLRVLHGMNRFSEDLDFRLKRPDPEFKWKKHLDAVRRDCSQEGIDFEIQDKAQTRGAARKAFLKTDSVGTDSVAKILTLSLPYERYHPKKIRIKLEIDTNPPGGSAFETSYVKGRDWYDLVWYVTRGGSGRISCCSGTLCFKRARGPEIRSTYPSVGLSKRSARSSAGSIGAKPERTFSASFRLEISGAWMPGARTSSCTSSGD